MIGIVASALFGVGVLFGVLVWLVRADAALRRETRAAACRADIARLERDLGMAADGPSGYSYGGLVPPYVPPEPDYSIIRWEKRP